MSCSASIAYGNDRKCLSDAADPSDSKARRMVFFYVRSHISYRECSPLHLAKWAPNGAMVHVPIGPKWRAVAKPH
jgi:hypothetical protein